MKIITFFSAVFLGLSVSLSAFAESDDSQGSFKVRLKEEKGLPLTLAMPRDGESQMGEYRYGKSLGLNHVYYLDMNSCLQDSNCDEPNALVLGLDQEFVSVYHQAWGRAYIKVADKKSASFFSASIPIRLWDNVSGNFNGEFSFKRGDTNGHWQGLAIRLYFQKAF